MKRMLAVLMAALVVILVGCGDQQTECKVDAICTEGYVWSEEDCDCVEDPNYDDCDEGEVWQDNECVVNTSPTLSGTEDATVEQGTSFDPLFGVTASDAEDGDLTELIDVNGTVDTDTIDVYSLTYAVSDSDGATTTALRTVTVIQKSCDSGQVLDTETNTCVPKAVCTINQDYDEDTNDCVDLVCDLGTFLYIGNCVTEKGLNVDVVFDNTDLEDQTVVIEAINQYRNKLMGLSGGGEEPEGLRGGPYEYGTVVIPEDLTEDVVDVLQANSFENALQLYDTLGFFREAINACASFEEDVFCDAQIIQGEYTYDYHIKAKRTGQKLYIESYSSMQYVDGPFYNAEVKSDLLYFNLAQRELELVYVRDYYFYDNDGVVHYQNLDVFRENQGIKNIAITTFANGVIEILYQEHNRNNPTMIEYWVTEGRSSYVLIDVIAQVGYSQSNDYGESGYLIRFFDESMNEMLRYKHNENNEDYIQWNLAYVSGWTKVDYVDSYNATVYLNEDPILTEDQVYAMSFGDYAFASVTRKFEGDISESIFQLHPDLTTQVTYDQLIAEIYHITSPDSDWMDAFGSPSNDQEHVDTLLVDFPFLPDIEIVNTLIEEVAPTT